VSSSVRRVAAAATVIASLPTVALAHTGLGSTHGFEHGFAHPVTGLDHILAMVMVGVLAFQLGGRALWLLPLTFVAVMAGGGLLGLSQIDLPFVEFGIAASVIVLGGAVAAGVRLPLALTALAVGLFAVFHGYAHGAEIPENAGGLGYALGFMTATALLHISGIALGYGIAALDRTRSHALVRAAGGLVALAGAGILAGAI
jgi:urease accessory protein